MPISSNAYKELGVVNQLRELRDREERRADFDGVSGCCMSSHAPRHLFIHTRYGVGYRLEPVAKERPQEDA
ncbi:MAG: hypothetical protein M3312_02355 [Actinomycetota bacterium]|nr:hypothetical protein [Actinomycetota bacterium]